MSEQITLTCFRCNHEHHLPYKCDDCGSGELRHFSDRRNGVFCENCKRGWNMYTCENCKKDFALTSENVSDPKGVSDSFLGIFIAILIVAGIILFSVWVVNAYPND
jgi:predicted RNA-binding Zn-ribbon protein involved in translation (DUF1610 family)